jgi:nitroreductase
MKVDVLETIRNRASVRSFTSEPLTRHEIDVLMDAALRAPSSGNLLHYSVVKVTDQTVKDTLHDICFKQPFIKAAPLVLVFNADQNRNQKWIEQYGGHFHFDGPAYLGKGICDALIASENVVLAAEGLGLGSVYVGTVLNRARDVRRALNYPQYVVPVVLLAVGHPKAHPGLTPRIPLRAICHEQGYQDFSPEEIRAIYGEKEAEWKAEYPDGVTGANGAKAHSVSEYFTMLRYTETGIREADREFMAAVREAGFMI